MLFGGFAIAQAPLGTHFVPTRETPSNVLYDSFHQRFFATVPGEDSIYVLAEADGSVQAKITVPSAFGLDLSVDGKRLYVTSSVTVLGDGAAQGYFIVDTSTLHIISFVQPGVLGTTYTNSALPPNPASVPRFIAAMSNGNVAYVAEHTGVTGGYMYLNNPATNLATPLFAAYFYDGGISKSLDGSTFIATSGSSSGDSIYLFDAASSTFTATLILSSTNSADVVLSPNGQQVLVGGHLVYNRSLVQLTDLAPGSSYASASVGSTFSTDGSLIYVLRATPQTDPYLVVYNAATLQLVGYLPVPFAPGGNVVQAIAVGASHHVVFPTANGFLEMDASVPLSTLPTNPSLGLNSISPNAGVASSPTAVVVAGSGFQSGSTMYFGQTVAATTYISANQLNAQPPVEAPGVQPVMVSYPNGWAELSPNAYSYGPVVTQQDVTAGSTAGGTVVKLYGYGLSASGAFPQITVGGKMAIVTAASQPTGLQSVTFTTPAGTAGLANVTVTSSYGSTTVTNGFRYLTFQLISSVAPYQMIVDNTRGMLYVADATSGNVLQVNASTMAVSTLFSSAASPSTALAMTPDGATLISASYYADTLDLINLSNGQHIKTIVPAPGNVPNGLQPGNIVATARGTVLVSLNNPNGYVSGTVYEVNLISGAVTALQAGASAQNSSSTLFAVSSDGNHVYLTADGSQNIDGGELDLWQASSDAQVATLAYTGGIEQLATNDAGDIVLQDQYARNPRLQQFAAASPSSTIVAERQLVEGEKLHSSGALGYVPTTLGVEVFDVHHGMTVLSIGIPAGSLESNDNLAIDHFGTRLYVAQNNGIGVIDLGSATLSIGSLTPSQGAASGGVAVVLRGSGFQSGVAVTIDGNPAAVQYVDSTTLQITTPAITAAKDVVVVTNPDGTIYSLDAAFDATGTIPATPTLSSVQPSYLQTGSGGAGFLVDGSGLLPQSVVLLNGQQVPSTFNNTGQLIATFPNLPGPGKQAVTVVTPPNAVASNAVYITTYSEGAYLNSVTPSTIPAGSAGFQLTAFGNGTIDPTAVVNWNGSPLATTYFNRSYLYASVPAALVATPGTASVTVATPGFATSNAVTFTITQSVAAATLTFASSNVGPVLIGNSATVSITVTSTGSIPLSITGFQLSDSTNFAQTNTCPAALSTGQTCSVQVTFHPTASVTLSGPTVTKLTMTSNASTAPAALVLNGLAAKITFGGASSISVTAGATGTTALTFSTYGPQVPSGIVSLSCSAGLPANSSCNFSPTTQTLATNMSATLTILTSAGTRGELEVPRLPKAPQKLEAGILLFLVLGFRRRRAATGVLLLLSSLCLAFGLSGCSGKQATGTLSGNTPAGSYTVTVMASASGSAASTTINLNVN